MPLLTSVFHRLASPLIRTADDSGAGNDENVSKHNWVQRIHGSRRAFAGQGLGLAWFWSVWLYALNSLVYGWALWTLCLRNNWESDSERRLLIRVVCFNLLWEIAGLGSGFGPSSGKFWPPFTAFFHFVFMGTAKVPLVTRLQSQTRRTIAEVGLFALFLNFVAPCAFGRDPNVENQLIALICSGFVLGVSDQTFLRAMQPDTYLSMLVVLTLSASAGAGESKDEWIDSVRMLMVLNWFMRGHAKLSPSFAHALTGSISGSPLVPLVLKHRMYASYPNNLSPARSMPYLAKAIAFGQMIFPIGLMIGGPIGSVSIVVGCLLFVLEGTVKFASESPLEGVAFNIGFMLWSFLATDGSKDSLAAFPLACHGIHVSNIVLSVVAYLIAAHLAFAYIGNERKVAIPLASAWTAEARFEAGDSSSSFYFVNREAVEAKMGRVISYSVLPGMQLRAFYDIPIEILDELSSRFVARTTLTQTSGNVELLEQLQRKIVDCLKITENEFHEQYSMLDGTSFGSFVLGWSHGDAFEADSFLIKELQHRCELIDGDLFAVHIQPSHNNVLEWKILRASGETLEDGRFTC